MKTLNGDKVGLDERAGEWLLELVIRLVVVAAALIIALA